MDAESLHNPVLTLNIGADNSRKTMNRNCYIPGELCDLIHHQRLLPSGFGYSPDSVSLIPLIVSCLSA